jgi:Pyridoxal-phosphate dependent enzyme
VHAYDQRETLLGQGSVGMELEADRPDIDTLLVATGGGGLIGGIAAWYACRVRVVSVEPEAAPTLHDALQAGHPVDAPAGGIAADSLAPRRVGALMFPIAQLYVAAAALGRVARHRRTRRGDRPRRAALRPLPPRQGRADRRAVVRRKHKRGGFRGTPKKLIYLDKI